jgi:membrane-associated protein
MNQFKSKGVICLTFINYAVDLIAKINTLIEHAVSSGGSLAYIIMFLILFVGAAFVFTAPMLPSVSLIFLVASLSVAGLLNPFLSFIVLIAAIALGDLTSYYIGKIIRHRVINNKKIPFLKDAYINRTILLYEKADFLSIVFARFTPVIGSFAQFVAGTINHNLGTFCKRNIIGGVIWLLVNFTGGYLVASIPGIKSNFTLIFMLVPFASLLVSGGYHIARNIGIAGLIKRA